MNVVTHLHVTDESTVANALSAAGFEPSQDGPMLAILDAPVATADVTDVLADWIIAARDAIGRGVDVVTVLADDHLDGDDVGKVTVGNGLIGASRSYAFEGEREGLVANVVIGPVDTALTTARWVLEACTVSGQVLLTGSQGHGRQRP